MKVYKEPSVKYTDDLGINMTDSPARAKARRRFQLFRLANRSEVLEDAIINLLTDRDRLGFSIDAAYGQFGMPSVKQFNNRFSKNYVELPQDQVTSRVLHLLRVASGLDAEELSVMVGCKIEQAEAALQELQRVEWKWT